MICEWLSTEDLPLELVRIGAKCRVEAKIQIAFQWNTGYWPFGHPAGFKQQELAFPISGIEFLADNHSIP